MSFEMKLIWRICVLSALIFGMTLRPTTATGQQAGSTQEQVLEADQWFDEFPLVGELSPLEYIAYLEAIGDFEAAQDIRSAAGPEFDWPWPWPQEKKPYEHTSHAFGFIPLATLDSTQPVPIVHAGNMKPDSSLKNKKLRLTLEGLRVFDYPGGGVHHVLFDFYAENQLQQAKELIHFNQTFRVQEGQKAPIIGYPIFIGLSVGNTGVSFKILTVNVKNEGSSRLLSFLDSDIFKSGLNLIGSLNPAIPVISTYATGITKAVLKQSENRKVQDIFMGLDFNEGALGARLAIGSYIAVQLPDPAVWNWGNWVYNPANGQIVSKADLTSSIDYNYLVFRVSEYQNKSE